MTETIYERPHDYDLEHAGDCEDIDFYTRIVTRYRPRRVLELACGSGRVTIPLAQAGAELGFDVVGLDLSESMLAEAESKLVEEPREVRARLTLVRGDVRTWESPAPFDLIVTPCCSFSHLLTLDDQLAAWKRCYHNLTPGGRLMVELVMPNLGVYAESLRMPPRTLLELDVDARDEETGQRMLRYKATEYEAHEQRAKILFVYDKFAQETPPQRFLSDFASHVYYPREVQLLFMNTGFQMEAMWGDYRCRPLGPRSQQIIAVGRR